MTAIAGLWRFDGRPDGQACVTRMLTAQSIYGPHDKSLWNGGDVALGRQLFRILPEDTYDRGPVTSADGNLTLVADVRLDNRDELTGALGVSTGRAQTMCDAALLLAAYERWEDAVVDRLTGDFAFALWDERRRRLVLARDFLGQRPLHYHRAEKFFAFASMPRGLHALDEIPYAPDSECAAEFLALLPESGSRSFFAGIERVEAGHSVVVTSAGVTARRYWEPARRTLTLGSAEDYAEGLRHHLGAAVRARLRGTNGHVGAQLSAGLDSSTIAATAARIMAPTDGRVTAFTSVPRRGYSGPVPRNRLGDEGPLAAATAALYPNMDHVLIHGDSRSPLDALDRNFFLFERPVLNLCNGVWNHAINDAAQARKLNVLLTGQMGNMSISYNGLELFAELLVAGRWSQLIGQACALVRSGHARGRSVAAATVGPFMPAPLWRWIQRIVNERSPDIRQLRAINEQRLAALDLSARAQQRNLDLSFRPWRDGFSMRLWVLRRVDMGNYNKGTLGGWGIDQRDPTADRRLIEFCLSVPTEQFLSDGVPRALAHRAFADRLPPEVLSEKRKGLQAIDWHEGLTAARQTVAEEIDRLAACAPAAETLDLPRLRALVETWPRGGWEQEAILRSYRLALLRGISAGHFLRKTVRSNR